MVHHRSRKSSALKGATASRVRPLLMLLAFVSVMLVSWIPTAANEERFVANFSSPGDDWLLGGSWKFLPGQSVLVHDPLGFGDAVLKYGDWADVEIETSFSVEQYGKYGSVRLMFRWQGEWVGYGLTFHEGGTTLYRFDGNWDVHRVLGTSRFKANPGDTYQAKVVDTGGTFEVYIDGQKILSATDRENKYASGRVGVKVDNARARLNSFAVAGRTASSGAGSDALGIGAGTGASASATTPAPEFRGSAPVITGTFLQLDGTTIWWSRDMWSQEFDYMKTLGFDTLIIQYAAFSGTAYYRSQVIPNLRGDGNVIQTLLDEAAVRGMKVWLGTSHGDGWGDWSRLKQEADENKRVIDELASLYAQHPAFAGWYIPHELQLQGGAVVSQVITSFYATIADYARSKTPGKPVSIAPYFYVPKSVWTKFSPPRVDSKVWERFLRETKVDVIMLQDGIGANPGRTLEEIAPYYRAMREAADRVGIEFWNDLENFDASNWQPTTAERVVKQLEFSAPYVHKTVIFEFNHYMSPLRGYRQGQQYEQYREWLQARAATVQVLLLTGDSNEQLFHRLHHVSPLGDQGNQPASQCPLRCASSLPLPFDLLHTALLILAPASAGAGVVPPDLGPAGDLPFS